MSMSVDIDKPLTDQDVEEFLLFLEQSDEVKCEYGQNEHFCTVTVTHRVWSCAQQGLICTNAATVVEIKKFISTCEDCMKPARDCWHMVLV